MQKRENKAKMKKRILFFSSVLAFCFPASLLPCFPACCMILLCAPINSSDDELIMSLSRACQELVVLQ